MAPHAVSLSVVPFRPAAGDRLLTYQQFSACLTRRPVGWRACLMAFQVVEIRRQWPTISFDTGSAKSVSGVDFRSAIRRKMGPLDRPQVVHPNKLAGRRSQHKLEVQLFVRALAKAFPGMVAQGLVPVFCESIQRIMEWRDGHAHGNQGVQASRGTIRTRFDFCIGSELGDDCFGRQARRPASKPFANHQCDAMLSQKIVFS